MITSAAIQSFNVLPQPLPVPDVPRGHPAYPLDVWDLIDFKRCGRRWLHAPAPTLNPKVGFSEMLRLLSLGTPEALATYAHRPKDFTFTRLECPSCGSISPAKVCRACGQARVSITDTRQWNGNSKYCTAWHAEQVAHARRIVADEIWEHAAAARTVLAADPAAAQLADGASTQQHLTGLWHDDATGLDIPLRTVLSAAPDPTGPYGKCLATLMIAADSSRAAWDRPAIERGNHIAAAFKHALHTAATGQTRHTHCWVIVEKFAPHLVSRRSTTPELLSAGLTLMTDLLAEYAACLASGLWSTFDSDSLDPSEAFTPIAFQPWMANPPGAAAAGCYPFIPEVVEA